MPRVVHFEIHAEDPRRAIGFYSEVFEWSFRKWTGPSEYWFIDTGPSGRKGINGGLVRRRDAIDTDRLVGYVCTIDVPSVDDYVEKVRDAGGRIVTPKFSVPGFGWLAHAKDTEGNIFGMMQADPDAD